MTASAPTAPVKPSALTPRQREVLRLQAYGFTYQEISERLDVSVWTVKNHHKQAVRSLQGALHLYPTERVRTSLACYIMGLLDGGMSAPDIVRRLREVAPGRDLSAPAPGDLPPNEASVAAD